MHNKVIAGFRTVPLIHKTENIEAKSAKKYGILLYSSEFSLFLLYERFDSFIERVTVRVARAQGIPAPSIFMDSVKVTLDGL